MKKLEKLENLENFKNLINLNINKYLTKYDNLNKCKRLITAIKYSINVLNDFDYLCSYIPFILLDETFERIDLSISILFFIIAIKTSFNFPKLLNKFKNDNNTFCIHNIFGETISYLVSFSILTEATSIILNSKLNKTILKINTTVERTIVIMKVLTDRLPVTF